MQTPRTLLGTLVQERHWQIGVNSFKGHQDDGAEALPLQWGGGM